MRLVIAALVAVPGLALAQSETMSASDEKVCAEVGDDRAARVICMRDELIAAEDMLSGIWPLILESKDVPGNARATRANRAKIRDAQRNWMSWRDAECRSRVEVRMDPAKWELARLECHYEMTVERLETLKDLYLR